MSEETEPVPDVELVPAVEDGDVVFEPFDELTPAQAVNLSVADLTDDSVPNSSLLGYEEVALRVAGLID